MVAWCIPLSFLLWRAREVTGSLLAPAVLHGALNGFAGAFTIILVDANPVVAAPAGLVGAVAVAVVAALFWWLTRKRVGRTG
jgi:tryptophan-rich sensory protein